jgi:aldehyde dehydrogenase (NAD+)
LVQTAEVWGWWTERALVFKLSAMTALTIFEIQKKAYHSARSKNLEWRLEQLRILKSLVENEKEALLKALFQDLHKHPTEAELSEVLSTVLEIDHAAGLVKNWIQPNDVPTPARMMGTSSHIRPEPKGVVLILAPWNYPFYLVMAPLAAALAAGNHVIIKPSEHTPEVSSFIRKNIEKYFKPEIVSVVEGDSQVASELLKLPFDHIFFTGSTSVGKKVMAAASENLTSVTLELGGKSPTIIDQKFSLKAAADRILWGKFLNAGQTCVAPDYVCVPEDRKENFIAECVQKVQQMYPEKDSTGKSDMCRIVNKNHFNRLRRLFQQAIEQGAQVVTGGNFDEPSLMISPTILNNVSWNSEIMREEIFGPILPVLGYNDENFLIDRINRLGTPLALYVFTDNKTFKNLMLEEIPSGGACIGHNVVHLMNSNLPFGGKGPSGMGAYHGYRGFVEFSHMRAIMEQGPFTWTGMITPPYGKKAEWISKLNLHLT